MGLPGLNQGVSSLAFLLEAPGEGLFLASSSQRLLAFLGSRPHHPDACFCHHISFSNSGPPAFLS